MKLIIGLTGPTGAGKSTAAKIAEDLRFQVIDCDLCARKAVIKDSGGYYAVISSFGEDILDENKEIVRKRLAKKAFSSKENTELLNRTLFPFIIRIVKEKITSDFVLIDAPTLFDSGLDSICDKTVAVLSKKEIRLKRILARDKISEPDALLRIGAGKSDEYYLSKADTIIYNDGNPEEFSEKFREFLNNCRKEKENV